MAGHEREYRWYLTGCDRLGHTPLPEAEFAARWQEFENHAERLKQADKERTLENLEADLRAQMQRRIQDDPFVKAVLVGMAEAEPVS
jgi:2-polyprenyl-6-methoxyphenol hydroxylase-like FAD-dependent oxidoreductase